MSRKTLGLVITALAACAAAFADDKPGEKSAAAEKALAAMKKELGDGFRYRAVRVFAAASDAEPAVFDRICAHTLADCYDAYERQFFRTKPAGVLRVYLFKDDASYREHARRLFGAAPDTPFGYFSSEHNALVMNIGTGGGTLVHEMFHALVRPDFPGIPAWANEGIASLFEQCGFAPDGSLEGYVNWRLGALREAIRKGELPSLRKIMTSADAEFYRARGAGYAAARYFMLYLQERHVLVDFYRKFRDRFAEDKTGVKFAEEVLGRTLEQVEPQWRIWVTKLNG